MNPDTRLPLDLTPRAALEPARRAWGWLLAFGILQIVAGMIALVLTAAATYVTMVVLGVLALVGAVTEIASVFWSRRWEGGLLHLIVGLLYGVFGVLVLANPGLAAVTITLVLAGLLIVEGVLRIAFALARRFHGRGWVVVSGVVSILLGMMIWSGWPWSGLWVIGLFVGIDLLFMGWKWVVVALVLRNLIPRADTHDTVTPAFPAG